MKFRSYVRTYRRVDGVLNGKELHAIFKIRPSHPESVGKVTLQISGKRGIHKRARNINATEEVARTCSS